jgi:predicted Zn-dependent protease
MQQGDFDAALEEMRAAKATAGQAQELYHATRGEAQVLEALGRVDEAVAAWDAVIATGIAAPVDRRQRGTVLRRANRNADACRDLRESVRDEPGDEGLRLFASSTCEAAGEIETAERILRDGLVLPTDSPSRAKALIDFYARVGKWSSAQGLLATWTRDFPGREDFRQWADELRARQP